MNKIKTEVHTPQYIVITRPFFDIGCFANIKKAAIQNVLPLFCTTKVKNQFLTNFDMVCVIPLLSCKKYMPLAKSLTGILSVSIPFSVSV